MNYLKKICFIGYALFNCVSTFAMDDYTHQMINLSPYKGTPVIFLCDKNIAKNYPAGKHTVEGLAIRIPSDDCGKFIQYARKHMHPNGIKIVFEIMDQYNRVLKVATAVKPNNLDEMDLSYRLQPPFPQSYSHYPFGRIKTIQSIPLNLQKTHIIDDAFKGHGGAANQSWTDSKNLIGTIFVLALLNAVATPDIAKKQKLYVYGQQLSQILKIILAASFSDMFPAYQFPQYYK